MLSLWLGALLMQDNGFGDPNMEICETSMLE